jgi:hypothetical protein
MNPALKALTHDAPAVVQSASDAQVLVHNPPGAVVTQWNGRLQLTEVPHDEPRLPLLSAMWLPPDAKPPSPSRPGQ